MLRPFFDAQFFHVLLIDLVFLEVHGATREDPFHFLLRDWFEFDGLRSRRENVLEHVMVHIEVGSVSLGLSPLQLSHHLVVLRLYLLLDVVIILYD